MEKIDLNDMWQESTKLACSPSGESEDNFTKLYNILIRLIYENKRLAREEYENEQEILR